MDAMEEKASLAYIQQEAGCLQQQHEGRHTSGLTRRRPSTTFFNSKSTIVIFLLCCFICIMSLPVFWLTVKVQMLEARLDEVCKQIATADEGDFNSKLTVPPVPISTEQPTFMESSNELVNTNITDANGPQPPPETVSGSRTRRGNHQRVSRSVGSSGSQTSSSGTSQHALGGGSNQNHTFVHLTGVAVNIQCGSRWVSWHLPSENGYNHISTDLMDVVANTFIRIRRPGYYYIYSQLTYHTAYTTQSTYPAGFEMVRSPACTPTNPTVLLRTTSTQDMRNPLTSTDSAYVGGVFHFEYLDEIAVRKSTTCPTDVTMYAHSGHLDTYNYFGAVLLIPTLPSLSTHSCSQPDHQCTGTDDTAL